MTGTIAIGSGGVGAGDRLEPAKTLADSGHVDYMGFDALAERTLALAQVRRAADPGAGHDERIPQLIELFAPFLGRGGRIIGNFGAANPDAAAGVAVDGLRERGLGGTRLGVIRGDDVLQAAMDRDVELPERGCRIKELGDRAISAHAYIGAESIVELLEQDAQLIIGGRIADPSVWVGAVCYELGWALDDWDRVATATLVGHLLEGGVGRAPGPDASLPTGYPWAIVSDDSLEVTKLEGTGGPLDLLAAKTSLAHEIHDPTKYLTPDVTADFSDVHFEEVGSNRVRAHGARGGPRPEGYRILVGLDLGWKVVGEVSFGGPGCVERAQESGHKMSELLAGLGDEIEDQRIDIHGVNAVFGDAIQGGYPADCRLRVAARAASREGADTAANLYWQLYGNGGGGVTRAIDRAIGVTPAFLGRDDVEVSTEVVTA